jgi:S1-C subfamily serine protease
MRSTIHVIGIAALGFAAGAATMLLLGEGRPFGHQAQPPATHSPAAPPSSFADAVGRAAPAVVNVYGIRRIGGSERQPPATDQGQTAEPRHGLTSLGSGVLVSADGLLVTSAHIVDGADAIRAELSSGRVLDVQLLGIDAETDLAVLRSADPELPAVPLADPAALRAGDVVLAIGNPFGIGQTVSLGIVSAIGRTYLGLTDIENFIQTDAAINPGNSGGALLDARGRLVGINTAILSKSGLSEGVGFAIPIDMVMRVVDQIARAGIVERGWIGIAGRSLTPDLATRFGLRVRQGVLITRVGDGSPAARAGLRTGDVVTGANGRPLHSSHELREAVTNAGPAASLALELWRGSERLETSVATAERPPVGILPGRTATSSDHAAELKPGHCRVSTATDEGC